MTHNERRQHQRIPFEADVLVSQGDQQWRCELEDISLKGMLIRTAENVSLEPNSLYSVQLILGEGAEIHMMAKLSHCHERHCGLQWDHIELESLTHLRRLLELNLEHPEDMHRELAELG